MCLTAQPARDIPVLAVSPLPRTRHGMCYLELLGPAAAPARETAEFSKLLLHLETHLKPLPLNQICL